jgi:hypothetical protein
MTVSTLTPASTITNSGGAVTGAATVHAALSDSSDSSYVTFDTLSEYIQVALSDLGTSTGDVIKYAQWSIRAAHVTTSQVAECQVYVPSSTEFDSDVFVTNADPTPRASSLISAGHLTDANFDDAQFRVTKTNSGGSMRVYEVALEVTYITRPIADVTAPVSPISNTNAPTVRWTAALDAVGGVQSFYEVKIFTDAQYGAGGFNPDSSTPTETSGIVASSATSWVPGDPLPDDTYRAYVRVAQNHGPNWSAWDYIQFDLTANAPSVPHVGVWADDDDGRILIQVDDTAGGATTHKFEVQRSIDNGTTWETIRTTDSGLLTPSSGVAFAYDTEVGNGVSVRYRARALNIITEFTTYSTWSSATTADSWESTSWWLKSVSYPVLNMPIRVDSQPSINRPARQGIFDVLGRPDPIVVTDVRSTGRGDIRFMLDDAADQADLDALLDLGEPLLIQAPPTDHWIDRFVVFGDHTRARGVDKAKVGWTFDSLPWVEVAEPTDDVVEWPSEAGS